MEDGTLVFPVEGRNEDGLQFSTIMWSKDKGENWTVGEPAYYNTNECQVVELSDHSLMLNMRERSNRGRQEGNGRAIAVTADLGKRGRNILRRAELSLNRLARHPCCAMIILKTEKNVMYYSLPILIQKSAVTTLPLR